MGLIQLSLLVLVILNLSGQISFAKPLPASLRKVASNNNLLYKIATANKRGDEPPTNNIFADTVGGDDYYEDAVEGNNCPPGFILFLRNGLCVPAKCGYGTFRNRITGECEDQVEMINANSFIEHPPLKLIGQPRRSKPGLQSRPRVLGTLAAGLG